MSGQKPNIDLSKTEAVECQCGGKLFQEGYYIRTLSKFLAGTTQDALIPVATFYCVKCLEVHPKFEPKIG